MSSSATTTEERHDLPHPGEILKTEFMEPMGISAYALAKAVGVQRSRINEITHGRQRITAAMALRFGRFFGVDPQWFMNMQSRHDLRIAEGTIELSAIVPRRAA